MKQSIQPFNYNGVSLTVIADDLGNPEFEVNALCELLGYSNPRDALARHVSTEDVVKRDTLTAGGKQRKNFVKERGMWKLVMKSNAPNAEPVQDWIAGEVLPSIRKTGSYTAASVPKPLANPTSATRAHLMVVSAMQKIGVRKEMAMAVALKAIHEDTGLTTEPYRLALPGVEEVCNLNQKQLGDLIGVSAREIGKQLRAHGLMEDDESGQRVLTELGRQYGEMKPFSNNGHSGYEPRWKREALEVITSGVLA